MKLVFDVNRIIHVNFSNDKKLWNLQGQIITVPSLPTVGSTYFPWELGGHRVKIWDCGQQFISFFRPSVPLDLSVQVLAQDLSCSHLIRQTHVIVKMNIEHPRVESLAVFHILSSNSPTKLKSVSYVTVYRMYIIYNM